MSRMTDETDVYICGICKKEFQDFVAFLQHKSTFGVFKCKLCNLSYHDREDIQKHINQNHANQKVDVAFTIPNKAASSIVSTKTEPEPDDTPKSGCGLSVFTCRLCNRFTLVEKTMLQHLESVHKIHVVPRSVELAALMLCSKPLDSATVPKLLNNPVVVKTVTPPVAKPAPVQSAETQTVLCTANIFETTMAEIDSSPNKDPEFFSNWALFAEVLGSEGCEDLDSMMPEMTHEVAIIHEDDVIMENGDEEVKKVRMESILKANILGAHKAKSPIMVTPAEEVLTTSRESNVCIDGGHDYISIVETKGGVNQMIIEEHEECVDAPTTIVLASDVEEFTSAYVEPSANDEAPISFVEQIVTQDSTSVVVTAEPVKIPVTSAEVADEKKPVKAITNPTTIKPSSTVKESRHLVPTKPRVMIKMEIKEGTDEEEEREEILDDNDQDESAEQQESAINEEPQPGTDGMYHCRKCQRAFARERQFKAHMNMHAMYGEHVMDSPSSKRAVMEDPQAMSRKRQKAKCR